MDGNALQHASLKKRATFNALVRDLLEIYLFFVAF